ncbi:serine hydrolase domain-containing protein [Paracoccus aminophilus]|uniref:Beta-lactamase n=1 Tax=Paracoccus aminophilus JCM 7686 TaxID=1367847 RepID=S5YQ70_PARAH|nr:serine hydrolase domain-containing protein [Paracoccus aminophilus]AGT07431.1 beta-lactamase [Paracoccus aminophilus JCM 7686]
MSEMTATEALDRAIDSALAENRIVGAAVLMAEDGETVYARNAGLADREAGREVTPATWFRYSSVSKPFTTVAALRLMQDGRLSPEDPVVRWLPDFTPAFADGTRPEITVNHLLSHMAGLDYGFGQLPGGSYETAGVSDGISERAISLAENIRRIASVPLDLTPGEDWRYSVATDVLGAVIEAVTDNALPFAMADLVTGPLALDAAYFLPGTQNLAAAYTDARPEPRRMEGVTHAQGNLPEGYRFSYDPERITDLSAFPSGGGGMAGTAEAALTLLETLRAGDFIAPEWRRAATEPRFAYPHPMRGPGMSHGWAGAIVTDPALAGIDLSPGSFSWGGIYGHSWFIDPTRRRTVLVMTNTAVEGMAGQLSLEAMAAISRP